MTQSNRLALVIGTGQLLAYVTTYYVPAVATSLVAAQMGVSPTLLFGGFTWAMLLAGFVSPWVGERIERRGGRGVLAAGAATMAAGLLIMSAWPSVPGWYLGWTVTGLGMGLGLYDAAFATIGRLLGADARPAIVGVTLLGGFAASVGWTAGAFLVQAVGWRMTLLGYAAVNLGVTAPLMLLLVPRAKAKPAALPGAPVRAAYPAGSRMVLALLATFFSVRSGLLAIVSVHILVLFHGLGLSTAAAVAAASLIGPAQVGARIAEMGVIRWMNPWSISVAGAVLMPAAILAMLAGAPVWGFAVIYGVSNGVLTISRGVLPLYLFGPEGYASLLGRLAFPALIMQAVSPTLVAPFVLSWPASRVFFWGAVASAAAMLCLLPMRWLRARAAV